MVTPNQLSDTRRRGQGGVTGVDSLFGVAAGISSVRPSNLFARGRGDRLRSFGQIAGQRNIDLEEDEQEAVSQFFSPRVTDEQAVQLRSFAKLAAGRGLTGGAVGAQVQDRATGFLAQNRAESFGRVRDVLNSRLSQVESNVNPFLRQLSSIRRGGLIDRNVDVRNLEGDTLGSFAQFAQPGLRALSSLGLGADALTTLARERGIIAGAGGVTGREDVSQAFAQFIDPNTDRTRLGRGLMTAEQNRSRFTFGSGRAAQRLGAGEALAGIVGQELQQMRAETRKFNTLGGLTQTFASVGGRDATQRLANLDFGEFEGITGRLGLGAEREAPGRLTAPQQATFFALGNPLFRSVFGA